MKKIINPWLNHAEYNCFGCCPKNPIGLHMEFYEDGENIVSTWHPEKNFHLRTIGHTITTIVRKTWRWKS